ncbi:MULTISPECIES: hypothetical protein [Psychrobacter]|uniref:hypothetical protein n=1 Tax=Psychrobacter TaxID=497 RepID=UPI00146BEA33|nr:MULTISPECIES: hypothetical protein [Psychrobacter]
MTTVALTTASLSFGAQAAFDVTEPSATATCPANHKMYYIGANAPKSTTTQPVTSTSLAWTAGALSRNFAFNEPSGNKIFTISFSQVVDLNNNSGGTPPFFGSIDAATASAINMVHNSTGVKTNHVLTLSTNRATSKTGYKIQDVDSTKNNSNQVPYIEQVDVSAAGGQLTYDPSFHTINSAKNIVTARSGINCGLGECTIDSSWDYKAANTSLSLKHNNSLSQVNLPHAVGYSDFFFCLAPPKLIVEKELNGTRVNDSAAKRDQFEIKVTGSGIVANSFTTTGTGATITNGSSDTLALKENTSYTITERVMNGTTLADLQANYDSSYTCSNATTGSTTVMPTAAMTYNEATKTRSFSLNNVNYGDEITCTITNTPKYYLFSGVVFNDNGGIADSSANANNADDPYKSNTKYFNATLDTGESGISGSTIQLVDCSDNNKVYAEKSTDANGNYNFVIAQSLLPANKICIKESTAPASYPIATSPNIKQITLSPTTTTYAEQNFGRVILKNAPLVLEKLQFANKCNLANLVENTQNGVIYSKDPVTASNPNIAPMNCIAYKLIATNRANLAIDNVVIQDRLAQKGIGTALITSTLINNDKRLSVPAMPAVSFNDGLTDGKNGTVKTAAFSLAAKNARSFYFNTKYGTTQSP